MAVFDRNSIFNNGIVDFCAKNVHLNIKEGHSSIQNVYYLNIDNFV